MNKNAWIDTIGFIEKWWKDVLIVIASILIAHVLNILPKCSRFIVTIIVFLIIFACILIINEIRWYMKRKRGFIEINPQPMNSLSFNEEEKKLWINIAVKNKFDKLNLNLLLKRLSIGNSNDFSDLAIGSKNKIFFRELNLENVFKEIPIAKGVEDNIFFLLDGEDFIYKAASPYQEIYLQGQFEIVLEAKGKINEKYFFQNFIKEILNIIALKSPIFLLDKIQFLIDHLD